MSKPFSLPLFVEQQPINSHLCYFESAIILLSTIKDYINPKNDIYEIIKNTFGENDFIDNSKIVINNNNNKIEYTQITPLFNYFIKNNKFKKDVHDYMKRIEYVVLGKNYTINKISLYDYEIEVKKNLLLNVIESSNIAYALTYLFIECEITSTLLIDCFNIINSVKINYDKFIQKLGDTYVNDYNHIILTGLDNIVIDKKDKILKVNNYTAYAYSIFYNDHYLTYIDVSKMFNYKNTGTLCMVYDSISSNFRRKDDKGNIKHNAFYFDYLERFLATYESKIVTIMYHNSNMNNYSDTLKEFIENVKNISLV